MNRSRQAGHNRDRKRGENQEQVTTRGHTDIVKLGCLIAIVLIIAAATHWTSLTARTLSFDDSQYLEGNRLVQNPSLDSTRRFFCEVLKPSTVGGYYQPLAMVSLMVDYACGGRADNLMPFHRTSLCLHLANIALIIILLYLLFGHLWAAVMVGLLFGVHPMTVEPIPWVGERKTLLSAFFALWCLITYVRYTQKRSWVLYSISLAMYALSLLSKPISITTPVLLLLLDYWPMRRLNKQAVLEKIPFFVIGTVSAVITLLSQNIAGGVKLPSEYGPWKIPLIVCHDIIFYLYKIVWPTNLSSHYPFPKPFDLSNPMLLAAVAAFRASWSQPVLLRPPYT